MFNPRPQIQQIPIGNGAWCVVVDNILQDPNKMVAEAVAQREGFTFNPATFYPGIERPMAREFDQRFEEYFTQYLKQPFNARRTLGVNTRMSIVTLRPEELRSPQRICHRDARSCAEGIFYDATVFHSGQIDVPELLNPNPARGRLTINAFLHYRCIAG